MTTVKDERNREKKTMAEQQVKEIDKLNNDTRERFIFLIHVLVVNHYGRYQYLQKRYGISSRKWQGMCNRVQLPGIDMLSKFLMHYPQYSTWLLTGVADSATQIDPTKDGYINQINQTELGPIDPSIPGWEEKYNKAAELAYNNSMKKYQTNP